MPPKLPTTSFENNNKKLPDFTSNIDRRNATFQLLAQCALVVRVSVLIRKVLHLCASIRGILRGTVLC